MDQTSVLTTYPSLIIKKSSVHTQDTIIDTELQCCLNSFGSGEFTIQVVLCANYVWGPPPTTGNKVMSKVHNACLCKACVFEFTQKS